MVYDCLRHQCLIGILMKIREPCDRIRLATSRRSALVMVDSRDLMMSVKTPKDRGNGLRAHATRSVMVGATGYLGLRCLYVQELPCSLNFLILG